MSHLLLTWLLAPLAWLHLRLSRSPTSPQNILLIQTAKIGDYICTTPLIRALRAAYPQARLSLLISPIVEPLARHQPGVDSVLTLCGGRMHGFRARLKLYRLLRREAFDTTLCISPNQAFLLIPFLARVHWRGSILPNFGGRSYRLAAPFLEAIETHQQGRMMVETGMALLQHLGIDQPLPSKEIVPAPGAHERVNQAFPALSSGTWIGLGVSSGNKLKELGKDKLGDLAKQLLDLDPDIGLVLIGSGAERQLAAELTAAISTTASVARIIDSTGGVALEDLAALIDRLSLYVGVDSGITYLADARDIPVIDIMGPADPEDQRPTGEYSIVIHSELPCAPCSHAFLAPYTCRIGSRACVANAQIQPVLEAAKKLLDQKHE